VRTPGGLTGIGSDWQTPGWRPGRSMSDDPWAADPVADLLGGTAGGSPGSSGIGAGSSGVGAGSSGVGAAGELRVAGLEWLGARAYDPATRGFLAADPVDPIAGAGWAGNPYAYAGNDPLHALDPTGLSPVTDAELKAYAAS